MGLGTESRNEVIVSAVLFALTSLVVGARFASVKFLHRQVNVSDILTAIAWVLLFGLSFEIILWATLGGNGEHSWELSPEKVLKFNEIFYANQINYFVLCPCIKLSICFFYRSIFGSIRQFQIASTVVACIIGAWGIAIIFAGIFQCTPIEYFWNPNIKGHCVNQKAMLYGVQYPNIIFDFTLLLLPAPWIWQVKTTLRNRLQLFGVFSLGGVGCVAGIVRVVVLGDINPNDTEYTIYRATVWTLVEPCIAMMCGSLPIVRGAIRVAMGRSGRKDPKQSCPEKCECGLHTQCHACSCLHSRSHQNSSNHSAQHISATTPTNLNSESSTAPTLPTGSRDQNCNIHHNHHLHHCHHHHDYNPDIDDALRVYVRHDFSVVTQDRDRHSDESHLGNEAIPRAF